MDVEFLRHKYEDRHDGVITKAKFKLGVRHIQVVYMFVCSFAMGALRSSNSIAILSVAQQSRNNGSYLQNHNWDKRIQGTVLSSFLVGYASAMLPAELYLKEVDDKFIMAAVLLINGGLTAAMPTIVKKGGWIAVSNGEFLMGITQACLSPVNLNLISKWLPPSERSLCGFLIQGAIILGTIIALPVSGIISESRLGWELIFYSQAMMTLSTATLWVLLTSSTPETHHAIGDTEKEYIRRSLSCYRQNKLHKPWRNILQTKQFWAIASAHTAANVLYVFFLVELSSFLVSMDLSIKNSGTQTALPFVGMWVVYLLTSPTIELIYGIGNVNYLFDVKYFRKIVNGFGSLGIVIGLLTLPYLVPSWNHLGLITLVGTFSLLGIQYSGFLENHKDMTQNYSNTLLVLSNIVSSAVAALVPVLTAAIVNVDEGDLNRWKIIFRLLAGFYVICNVVYTLCANSDRQEWDRSAKTKFGYCNALTNLELDEINQTTRLDCQREDDTSV
ncbi:putative inorganic phosphate cotransporter [Danaus plexippus plexippus]|uniref:Inorganic phosphate cotransporter n=1 Tax=Danaus plexippus plexippus TaxID=278856 RepID=A0A212F7R9_DANPL|nr:putative inorganic phosphate cotransporter [Danaus plexippus plexippus]